MSSSPSSDASSSDLYSPTENPELVPAHPAAVAEEHMKYQPGYQNAQHRESIVGSGNSSTNGLLCNPTTGNSSNYILANGQDHGIHPKRKRDEDEESDRGLQGPSPHVPLPEISSDSHVTVSHSIFQDDGPPRKCQLSSEDWSSYKRSSIEEGKSQTIGAGDDGRLPTLPDEIWQHIFSFVPPVSLGRLLLVNRVFHACLTKATGKQSQGNHLVRNAIRPVSANSVWAASRKRFAPGLPKPLQGLGELEMWRLLRGRQCQMCGESKVQNFATSSESPLESGPGDRGVRVLWPFGIRTCGSCLQKCSEKESALYVSPDCPFFLLSALPFAFVTATNHFVSNAALQGMAHLPPLKMEKHYYKPHIEDIKRRLAEARALGAPSVEEWMKGLTSEGKERHDDAVRWEQWEARGGLKKVNAKPPVKHSSTPAPSKTVIHHKAEDHSSRSTPHNLQLPAKPPVDLGTSGPINLADSVFSAAPGMAHFQPSWAPTMGFPDAFAQRPPGVFSHPRPERNIRDVNEAKAIRKAEIERRCQELQPPLPSTVLNHMESFQAAIQISQPLTDHAWEVLKPRLLAQRPYAERKEMEKIQQDEILQEEYKQRRQQEMQLKETKEALDREWDTVQAPVRNRISALADEIIAERWSNGDGITKDTSPKFAADVLMYVRERFYADIAREDEEARLSGQPVKTDQPNEPPTRKLILENMKWLFDTKIKALTENFQKELFLCNGCEGNFKFYGFEGVVQHYAAKHTTTLSMGSVVVHWRAEWPEHPPFHPNPSAAKAAYYKIPTPVSTSVQGSMNGDTQPQSYHGYGHTPDTNNASVDAQQTYPSAQPPGETHSAPYTSQQHSAPFSYSSEQSYHPYATSNLGPIPVSNSHQGHVGSHPGFPQTMYPNSSQGFSSFPQVTYAQSSPAYGTQTSRIPYATHAQGQEYGMPGAHITDPNSSFYGTNALAQQASSYVPRPIALHPSGLAPEVYQKQLDELAKHAREVWFGTSGIKDIPQSVRIFVVIHHVASRFAATFANEPTLAMFIDGLDNHSKMRPVRSLNGLACKTCVNASSSDGHQAFSQLPVADRKLYTLPHLLNHFRTAHVETHSGYPEQSTVNASAKLDWKSDMIELPELPLIADLINAHGVDDTKLALIASVFPEAFPNPLPPMGKRPANAGPVPVFRANHSMAANPSRASATMTLPSEAPQTTTPSNGQPFTRPISVLKMSSSRGQSSEPPGDDEYDPHRPAYLGKIIRPDINKGSTRPLNYTNRSPLRTEAGQGSRNSPNSAQFYPAGQPVSDYTTKPSGLGSGNSNPYYGIDNASGAHVPHGYALDSGSHSRFSEIYSTPSDHNHYHDFNGNAYNENKESSLQRLAQDGDDQREDSTAKRFSNHITSLSEAADQFLKSLPVTKESYPKAAGLQGNDRGSHSTPAWTDDARNDEHQVKYNQVIGPERWDDGQSGGRQFKDHQSSIDSIRAASSNSKAFQNFAQDFMSQVRSDEEYRSQPHIQIPLGTNRVGRSPQPYNGHSNPQQVVAHQKYAVNDNEIPRGDRASSYYQLRDPHYRSRSRSPRSSQVEGAFYRSRSPRLDPRHESLYHVVSPVRKDNQPQRVTSYEYPVQGRYEYLDNGIPTEDRYGRRIELLPVRYEEPRPAEASRYVLAPRFEEAIPPPGYIRVEQGYGAEQFYERDGQLYRTGPGHQAYAQGYRY